MVERLARADLIMIKLVFIQISLVHILYRFLMKMKIKFPFEFFIPRDPNLFIPPMFRQNVTSFTNQKKQLFHFHHIILTQNNPNLTFSLHFELHPLNTNLSYLLIYRFDHPPALDALDDWTSVCPQGEFPISASLLIDD
jgi:hypothetical protein